MKKSFYSDKPTSEWFAVTETLLQTHPLSIEEISEVILESWASIFTSQIGGFFIGRDIFPTPQIMSFLLHELVALNLEMRYPDVWKKGLEKNEKDLVCLPNNDFSIEIKASSDKKQVFGNRSYAQEESSMAQKSKSGFYITVNFEKFTDTDKPEITIIRFGYLEHSDWVGQAAATGQQARLTTDTYKFKLIIIYEKLKPEIVKKARKTKKA